MKPRFYFDTSVFGGVFDEEFKESSVWLFDKVKRGKITCFYSELTTRELSSAPERVLKHFQEIPPEYRILLPNSRDADELAASYIDEKVIGPASWEDCVHIAMATIHNADALVSWNFKHIVNDIRIAGYNSVNLSFGYRSLKIVSPKKLDLK